MSFTSPELNSFTFTAQMVEKINVTASYVAQFENGKISYYLKKNNIQFVICGDFFFVEVDIVIFSTVCGLKGVRYQLYVLAKSLNKTLAFIPVY